MPFKDLVTWFSHAKFLQEEDDCIIEAILEFNGAIRNNNGINVSEAHDFSDKIILFMVLVVANLLMIVIPY
ncbi:MAG: hypothetical protein CM15mP127_08970 [Gammaproteobacteria bacterium]|nr:MAG: hypothetical protein CM15mP127_08970 [Gammaproteobacteria bacterium]